MHKTEKAQGEKDRNNSANQNRSEGTASKFGSQRETPTINSFMITYGTGSRRVPSGKEPFDRRMTANDRNRKLEFEMQHSEIPHPTD